LVGHLGGETLLRNAGTFELGRSDGAAPVMLSNVYVVEPGMLPAGVIALLGVADIAALRISLDHVLSSPGCPREEAVPLTFFRRMRRAFRRCFGLSPPSERPIPLRLLPPVPRTRDRETEAADGLDGLPPARNEFDAGRALLDETRAHCSEEQR
jgi:hypothetical protein